MDQPICYAAIGNILIAIWYEILRSSREIADPSMIFPMSDAPSSPHVATFGAGCFWGVEEAFLRADGVLQTEAGYSGGTLKDPTYELVCTGTTGHAEVVRVTFDPAKISYEELLAIFFENHNPTTKNRQGHGVRERPWQGPDIGDQYRSVIFCHSDAQKESAEKAVKDLEASHRFSKPIVTQILPVPPFYTA